MLLRSSSIHESVTFRLTDEMGPLLGKDVCHGRLPKGTGVIKVCELAKEELKTVAEKESKVGFKVVPLVLPR